MPLSSIGRHVPIPIANRHYESGFDSWRSMVVDSGLIVGAALATTALGTLMPILQDAKELPTRFGAARHGCPPDTGMSHVGVRCAR